MRMTVNELRMTILEALRECACQESTVGPAAAVTPGEGREVAESDVTNTPGGNCGMDEGPPGVSLTATHPEMKEESDEPPDTGDGPSGFSGINEADVAADPFRDPTSAIKDVGRSIVRIDNELKGLPDAIKQAMDDMTDSGTRSDLQKALGLAQHATRDVAGVIAMLQVALGKAKKK